MSISVSETIVGIFQVIDIYCERCGPGLLAEPLNAITNSAFFLAAWFAFDLAHRRRMLNAETWLLIGLSIAIGTGSTLFHTFATPWAQLLDVLPILLFQLAFLWLYLGRVVRLRPAVASVLTTMFLVLALFVRRFSEPMNGSLPYVPALFVLVGLGVYQFSRCEQDRMALLAAAAAFSVALFFRSIDMLVCTAFPYGTHFLWHLLIATAAYLSMRVLILNQSIRKGAANTAR